MKTNKLIVPKRLVPAAEELKNNTICCNKCSEEVKEATKIAYSQGVLCTWNSDGKKENHTKEHQCYTSFTYCLPDDIEIVAEPELRKYPEWIEKEYTVCKIEESDPLGYIVNYPQGKVVVTSELGTPRIRGWQFCGWIHEGEDDLNNESFGWIDEDGCFSRYKLQDDDTTPSTAIATAWKKVDNG